MGAKPTGKNAGDATGISIANIGRVVNSQVATTCPLGNKLLHSDRFPNPPNSSFFAFLPNYTANCV